MLRRIRCTKTPWNDVPDKATVRGRGQELTEPEKQKKGGGGGACLYFLEALVNQKRL